LAIRVSGATPNRARAGNDTDHRLERAETRSQRGANDVIIVNAVVGTVRSFSVKHWLSFWRHGAVATTKVGHDHRFNLPSVTMKNPRPSNVSKKRNHGTDTTLGSGGRGTAGVSSFTTSTVS